MHLALYPQGKRPRHPLDRRLSEPRASLDTVENRNILPCQESNPGRPALAHGSTNWAIPTATKEEIMIYVPFLRM
jgi:hypothetical protein